MSTHALIQAVLEKSPNADPNAVLDLIVACDADMNKVFSLLGIQSASKKRQMTFDKYTTKKPTKVTKTSADVINLYTSSQVKDAGIFCAIHHNVLDSSVANQLAVSLNEESKDWKHQKFWLFDREVTSGHSSALYSDNEAVLLGLAPSSYQGRRLDPSEIFPFNNQMKSARAKIEKLVQEYTPNWSCDLAVLNRYANRQEKLDYHSDQLTYIGPKPTIAALSLGCSREFRLKDRSVPPQRPTYSILIPHNSVIIMYGECQERFKHCVPPAKSVDPDSLLGTTRISVTFRMYREQLSDKTIPKCQCQRTMILRSTVPNKQGDYKYIWQCGNHYQGGKGCNETKIYTNLLGIQ